MTGFGSEGSPDGVCYRKLGFLERRSGASVLDVGCRTGAYLRRLTNRRAVGLDLDLAALHEARKSGAVVRGDASALPFKANAFDSVVAGDVLEHVADDRVALREMLRVARRNVLISVPRRDVPEPFRALGMTWTSRQDPTHRRYYERDTIARMVEAAALPGGQPRLEILPWFPASKPRVGIWLRILEKVNIFPGFLVEVVKAGQSDRR